MPKRKPISTFERKVIDAIRRAHVPPSLNDIARGLDSPIEHVKQAVNRLKAWRRVESIIVSGVKVLVLPARVLTMEEIRGRWMM